MWRECNDIVDFEKMDAEMPPHGRTVDSVVYALIRIIKGKIPDQDMISKQ
jgi:hypothetical protein